MNVLKFTKIKEQFNLVYIYIRKKHTILSTILYNIESQRHHQRFKLCFKETLLISKPVLINWHHESAYRKRNRSPQLT